MSTLTMDFGPAVSSDFHPAARPGRIVRNGLIAIALAIGGVGTWSTLAPLSGAVIAPGVVKVEHARKSIQHLEGGIVTEIRVRDGDHVQAGQTLVVLSADRAQAQYATARSQFYAAAAAVARLEAESTGKTELRFPAALEARRSEPPVAAILQAETALFRSHRRTLEEQLGLLDAQAAQAREEFAGLQAKQRADAAGQRLAADELAANEALLAQGFVSKTHLLRLRRETESYASQVASVTSEMARTRQKLSDLQLRAAALRDDARNTAATELAMLRPRAAQLEASVIPAFDSLARRAITAPVSGTVVDSRVFTLGGVVVPGATVMDIVPDGAPLLVEGRVRVDDIGHVRDGMPTTVRLPAFPSRSTPVLAGNVSYVAADRRIQTDGQEYFVVQAKLDAASAQVARALGLVSGMSAELYLETGKRTALEYLLQPLRASMQRAGRQP